MSQLNNIEYPSENFVQLNGISPYLEGRIIVNQTDLGFDAEVDIILSESGKIYKHISIIYNQPDHKEALDQGYRELKKYLTSLKKM